MQKYHTQGSRRLYQATLPYLVDGVGSSFHVPSYRAYPIAMTHGKGSKLYDVDGNEYIDWASAPCSWATAPRRGTGQWRNS